MNTFPCMRWRLTGMECAEAKDMVEIGCMDPIELNRQEDQK
jgi:hypothetical protein